MQDDEFLDEIYTIWSRTTGAENQYWMPEEIHNIPGKFKIVAVGRDTNDEETRAVVATLLSEADADFLTAIHGSFADIVRRCHEAYDEADRLDTDHDRQEHRIYELETEIEELRSQRG